MPGQSMPRRIQILRKLQRTPCGVSLILLICVSVLAPARAQAPASPSTTPPGYHLVWSDEFNSPDGSLPDPAKWTYDLGGEGWGNEELEFYTNHPQNAHVASGNLVIT